MRIFSITCFLILSQLFCLDVVAREAHGVALLVGSRELSEQGATFPQLEQLAEILERHGFAVEAASLDDQVDLTFKVNHFIKTAPTHGVLFLYSSSALPIPISKLVNSIQEESGADFALIVVDGQSEEHSPMVHDNGKTQLQLVYLDNGGLNSLASRLLEHPEDGLDGLLQSLRASALWSSNSPLENLPALISPRLSPRQIQAAQQAGTQWVNPLGTVFVWCSTGQQEDSPRQGFWIGKYEITRREFDLVSPKKPKIGLATLANHPRDAIRYDDILQFIKQLNWGERFFKRLPADWEYALPSEKEWEHAAYTCGSRPTRFNDYQQQLPRHANFADKSLLSSGGMYYQYADPRFDDGNAKLTLVGSYQPNPWGLHDMIGNLWEWTSDNEMVNDKAYPVARGCSWVSLPEYCRRDFRHRFAIDTQQNFIGFRLVLRQRDTLLE